MEEGIIAMLYEAGLPLSFLGEALASFVHVWNQVSPSRQATHELFNGENLIPNMNK